MKLKRVHAGQRTITGVRGESPKPWHTTPAHLNYATSNKEQANIGAKKKE